MASTWKWLAGTRIRGIRYKRYTVRINVQTVFLFCLASEYSTQTSYCTETDSCPCSNRISQMTFYTYAKYEKAKREHQHRQHITDKTHPPGTVQLRQREQAPYHTQYDPGGQPTQLPCSFKQCHLNSLPKKPSFFTASR